MAVAQSSFGNVTKSQVRRDFGVRKLESLGYRAALFAWSFV